MPTRAPRTRPRRCPRASTARSVPAHVGIVMDGNGRWAVARGSRAPGARGRRGGARRHGLRRARPGRSSWLTVYAFSTENWRRPADEVRYLMNFNESLLLRRRDELNERGVRVRFSGRRDWRVPRRVLRQMDDVGGAHRDNRAMTLTMAFNYGGRAEIVDAVKAHRAGTHPPDKVDEKHDPRAPLPPRHARPRPRRAHVGGAPDLQLLALGARLRRARLLRRVLAGLPEGAPPRRGGGVPAPHRRYGGLEDRDHEGPEPDATPSLVASLAPYSGGSSAARSASPSTSRVVCVFAGWSVLAGPLIALPVIAVLVGAGNLFQGWLGVERPCATVPRARAPVDAPTASGDGAANAMNLRRRGDRAAHVQAGRRPTGSASCSPGTSGRSGPSPTACDARPRRGSGSSMEVLDHVDALLARGRTELLTVRQVEPAARASAIRSDFDAARRGHRHRGGGRRGDDRAPRGSGVLRDGPTCPRPRIAEAADPSVVATAFLFEDARPRGAAPVLDRCASCGATDDLVAFDLTEGGLLCRSCRRGRPVSPAAVALLRRMLLGGLAGVSPRARPAGGRRGRRDRGRGGRGRTSGVACGAARMLDAS